MWSGEVIKALPLVEFGFQIDIAFVGEELVELLFIGSMRSLDLAVQLGPVAFLFRPLCSFRLLFARRRPGFSSPVLSAFVSDYRNH